MDSIVGITKLRWRGVALVVAIMPLFGNGVHSRSATVSRCCAQAAAYNLKLND
jgi:hypothetical protein